MNSYFDKDYLPIWCEICDRQGYIFVDDFDLSCFVICETCRWETAEVWCPKCEMSGEFVENIGNRPSSWNCPDCKTKYELPTGFYESPMLLFTEEVLPTTVLERIKDDFRAANSLGRTLQSVITLVLGLATMIVVGLLPLALVFTPLPWTIPGFIVTLFVFVVWWWIIGKVVKYVRERLVKPSS